MEDTKPSKEAEVTTTCVPLSHPLRVRILEVVNEHPMSPVQFVNAGFAPGHDTKQQALSLAAYHFRALEAAGCIKIIETVPRRGATEHVYGGKSRVFFSDQDFEQMPKEQRTQLSRTSFQGLVARTDGAIQTGTFDARTDRHLTWRALELDEQGWKEVTDRLAGCFHDLEAIRHAAASRVAGSGERS